MAYKPKVLIVPEGGSGVVSNTAYAVLCGGTTSTGAIQSIASVGTSGQVLTSNGAGALPTFQDAGGGGSSSSYSNISDFTVYTVGPTPGFTGSIESPFRAYANGTSSSVAPTAGTQTNPGIANLATGTTTTGHAGIYNNEEAYLFGGGTYTVEYLINIPTLSDVTNTYLLHIGIADYNFTSSFSNGVYFLYQYDVNSGNWQIKSKKASGGTSTGNTNTAVSAGSWIKLKIIVNSDGTSVSFYVNGSEVTGSPLTSNIPISTGEEVTPFVMINKSAGTTSRSVQVDYISQNITLTTAR